MADDRPTAARAPADAVAAARPDGLRRVSRVFLPAWGVLQATVFLSVAWQMPDTFGAGGLLPLSGGGALPPWRFPSLLVLLPSDALAWALLGVGTLASCAAALGWRRGLSFAVAALCWWQLSVASPLLLGMPPDVLVLHGTVAAALLSADATHRAGVWLARLVVAKLYVEAGVAKLFYAGSGGVDEWLSGAFSASFFSVATIPGPLARAWHGLLPEVAYDVGAAVVVLGQVGFGLAILVGRRGRLAAFGFFSAFQLFLISGANFGALCWGSLVLGLTLVDDAWLPAWRPLRLAPGRRSWGVGVVGVWVVAQLAQLGLESNAARDPVVQTLRTWRLAYRYTMFLTVPPRRVEWRFHAVGPDGERRPLRFAHQLDPEATGGAFLGTLHPRGTFFLWFAATTQFLEDPASVSRGFAADDHSHRTLDQARWFARHLCRTRVAEGERIAMEVAVVDFAEAGPGWWTSSVLGVSPPVACDRLDALLHDPYAAVATRPGDYQ